MTWLSDIGFFALLFFVLVFIHELGHFLMAKWMGIRVEKFSIGMGPQLFGFRIGETEYRLAALPLGGYVKMSGDDPSKTYSEEEKKRGFLTQKPPAKLLVVFGGPVFNLILPIFVFGLMLAWGIPSIAPSVGFLQADMPALQAGLKAGDQILAVNGEPVQKWTEFEKQVQGSAGQPMALKIERPNFTDWRPETLEISVTPTLGEGRSRFGEPIQVGRVGMSPEFIVPQIFFDSAEAEIAKQGFQRFDRVESIKGLSLLSYEQWMAAVSALKAGETAEVVVNRQGKSLPLQLSVPSSTRGDNAAALGLTSVLVVVGQVDEGNPAFAAGIQPNDRIVSINGHALNRWEDVAVRVRESEGNPISVVWNRDGQEMSAMITPEKMTINDPVLGKDNPLAREPAYRIGIVPAAIVDARYSVEQSSNPIAWVQRGFSQTWEMTSMTVEAMFKLVTGQLSLKLLGSPIMIYKVAGNSYRLAGGGQRGWVSFFSTLALLSITLGIVNLFPIPVLDGGHATFFILEWIRGKPISLKTMELAMKVGLFMLISLFALVLYNDFHRYGWLDPLLNLWR
jgi:regulator of sigma E protease